MIKLYQFAFSHFCEKARWALDYKSIPYTPVNLLPGLRIKPIRKLAPKTCMPVLVDGERPCRFAGNHHVSRPNASRSFADAARPERGARGA